MLYGIRRDLQAQLTAEGFPASAYTFPSVVNGSPTSCVGWGSGPANVGFVIRGILSER